MFKCLALMLSLCVGAVGGALAQEVAYPTKTIRLVVPFPPGGSVDVVARMVSLHLQEKFGQTIVIENRPGAVGTMGTAQVAKAAPDGHTLVMTIGAHTIVPALMAQMPYDASRDLAAVTLIASAPNVLVVRPDFPARNLKEFVQLAKENPGKFSYSTAGNGSTTHVMTAMLAHSAGLSLLHVPYQGGAPSLQAILSGQTDLNAAVSTTALPMVKAGKLRALANAAKSRNSSRTILSNSSGPTAKGSNACASNFCRISGMTKTFCNSALILLRMGLGVPAGANKPIQLSPRMPG